MSCKIPSIFFSVAFWHSFKNPQNTFLSFSGTKKVPISQPRGCSLSHDTQRDKVHRKNNASDPCPAGNKNPQKCSLKNADFGRLYSATYPQKIFAPKVGFCIYPQECFFFYRKVARRNMPLMSLVIPALVPIFTGQVMPELLNIGLYATFVLRKT